MIAAAITSSAPWKRTRYRAIQALIPRLMARGVLPTPAGPRRRIFSLLSIKDKSASLSISSSSTEGWKEKSDSSKVFCQGNLAVCILRLMERSVLARVSSSMSFERYPMYPSLVLIAFYERLYKPQCLLKLIQ